MVGRRFQVCIVAAALGASLVACGAKAPTPIQGFLQYLTDLESIGAAISTAAGYPQDHVYVTGNRTYLHISILDSGLMAADAPALEQAAAAVVTAAEPVLAAHADFASVQVIRVGIYHPSSLGLPINEWHSENVLEFRRGTHGHFTVLAPR
jgi:hypothetical protein